MNKLLPLVVATTVLLPLGLAQNGQGQGDSQSSRAAAPGPGKLIRVEITDESGGPAGEAPGGDLDLEQVVTLLTATDLDHRERNFDDIVRAARVDREILKVLSDLAESRIDLDLAWTARLALREVRRSPRIQQGVDTQPFAFRIPGALELQELLLPGLEDGGSFGLFGPGFPGSGFFGPGAQGRSQSVEIRQEDGEFLLRIHESENGEETSTREFRGESLEAILEANPALREEMNIGAEGVPGGLRFRMGPASVSEQWMKMLRELQEGGSSDPLGLRATPNPERLKEFLVPLRSSRPANPRILGVRVGPVSQDRREELGLEAGVGLDVGYVEPGSMAHLMGVEQGSVLLELNEQPLRAAEDITTQLRARGPKEPVHILWIDGAGEKRTNVWRPGL